MKKNIFTRIIAIALIAMSIMAIAIPAMAASQTVTVDTYSPRGNGKSLNMRSSASSGASIVKTIPNNTVLTVTYTYKTDTWYRTTYDGVTGYVMGKFMRFSDGTYGGPSSSTHPQTQGEAFNCDNINNIGNGHQGNSVRNIQLCMYYAGYMSRNDVDGIFGDDTEAAVFAYQTRYQSECGTPDGIVGSRTKTSLWNRYETQLKAEGYK